MKKPGFSLVETLISSALILFLIMSTAQLLVFSLAAKRKADFHFLAASYASAKLEYLKSRGLDSQELEPGPHEELISDVPSGLPYRVEWRTEAAGENAKKIILSVSPVGKPGWEAVFCLLMCRELGF
ncbi:MAG: type II secretion system protein [Acidobacteriota bacterium]